MTRYSELARRLDAPAADAWAVHDRALAMQRSGEPVVVLSIGDPDFRTPDPIIDNAVSHLRIGRTHYSPALGEINLRRAVADYENRVSPHDCAVDQVGIFPGVTAGLFAALSCLVDRGDGVVVVDPQYVGYMPMLLGLDVDVQMVRARPELGFEPTADEIIDAIQDHTRVVLLNTPGNPTGAIIGAETLQRVLAECQARDIWLVTDEIYSMFTFDRPHVSARTAAERLDNLVVVDGLSKSHAMTGWRVGWTVAPAEFTEHLGRFAEMSIFGCPQFVQDAAAFALNNDEYYVRDMRDEYRRRRNAVCDRLDSIQGLTARRPEAGMFVMIDVRELYADDQQFANELLDTVGLSVLPGSAFGESTAGHVRFSLVQPLNVLMEGCQRLETFVSRL